MYVYPGNFTSTCDSKEVLFSDVIDWNNFSCHEYCSRVEESFMSLVICDNIGCTVDHREQIEFNYFMIVQSLNDGAGILDIGSIKNLLPSQDGTMFVGRNIRMPETHSLSG